MNSNNQLINSRKLSFLTNKPHLPLNKEVNYLFDLSYLGVLEVEGSAARDFLQGQLTCDVRTVSASKMIQGLQCNLKGRILATLDIIDWNGFKLILPQDLIELTSNSLNKTALLSKISLQNNHQFKILGFYLQNTNDLLPDEHVTATHLYEVQQSSLYYSYYLGNGFYIYIVDANYEDQFCNRFKIAQQFLGSLAWHHLRLAQGQIEIYPESRGLFLPHKLSLQDTQYISFNKGCYKGQEIIARTHFKATIKHQLKIFEIETKKPPYSGQKLLNNEGLELGEIIDYSSLNNSTYLIAVSILKNRPLSIKLEGQESEFLLKDVELI